MKPAKKEPGAFMPRIALFSAALIWGSSFVAMKNAVGVFPVNILLACRFGISFLALSAVFARRLKAIDRDYLKKTALIGLLLYIAYIFQTVGLKSTTPGKNAFLTAAYVVLVPFVHWLAEKRKPTVKNLAAGGVCLAGIGLISLTSAGQELSAGSFAVNSGDAFTLGGALFFAAHIVFLGLYTRGKDPVLITLLQFGYCTVYFGLTGLLMETAPPTLTTADVLNLLYLAFLCTALAMLFQNYGQKYVNPAAASLIMSLEAVFGVCFSVLLYGEVLTPRLLAGFSLVFAAILISEISRQSLLRFPALQRVTRRLRCTRKAPSRRV
ncbi:MAG: DMT family transporter [Clostridiales bacterium]|nr:DMT family transporter [Clostridiales bacterium]